MTQVTSAPRTSRLFHSGPSLAFLAVFVSVACGPSAEPDLAAASEGLAGVSSASMTLPQWTSSATIKATLARGGRTGTFNACIGVRADGANPFGPVGQSWSCGAGFVPVTFAAGDATKQSGNVSLPAGDGLKRVWVKFSGPSGTASIESATVVLDTTAPAFGAPSDVAVTGADRGLLLTFQRLASDGRGSGVAAYRVVQTNWTGSTPAAAPAERCTTGVALACRAVRNVLSCPGLKNGVQFAVRVCPVDRAGNVGAGLAAPWVAPLPSAHAGQRPTGVRLVLEAAPNAATGGVLPLTLSATSPDGTPIIRYCVHEAGGTCDWTSATSASASFSQKVRLALTAPKGAGQRTIWARVADRHGLESATQLAVDFDGAAPDDAALTFSVTNLARAFGLTVDPSSLALPGSGGTFVLSASAGADPVPGCAAKAGTRSAPESFVLARSGDDFGAGVSFRSPKLVSGVAYGLRLCAVDAAGNPSPGKVHASRVVHRAPPADPRIDVSPGLFVTTATTVGLTLSAVGVDGSKVVAYAVATSPTAVKAWLPFKTAGKASAKATHAIAAFPLGAGASTTVYAWFRDDAQTETATPAVATVTRDTTKPTVTLSSPDVFTTLDGSQFLVRVEASDDSGLLKTPVVSASPLFDGEPDEQQTVDLTCLALSSTAWECATSPTLQRGDYRFEATVSDGAGNDSLPATLDFHPPGPDENFPFSKVVSFVVTAGAVDAAAGARTATLSWSVEGNTPALGFIVAAAEGDRAPSDCGGGVVGATSGRQIVLPGLDAAKDWAFRICLVDFDGQRAGPAALLGRAGGELEASQGSGVLTGGGGTLTVEAAAPTKRAATGAVFVADHFGETRLLGGGTAGGIVRLLALFEVEGPDSTMVPVEEEVARAVVGAAGRWSVVRVPTGHYRAELLVGSAKVDEVAFELRVEYGAPADCSKLNRYFAGSKLETPALRGEGNLASPTALRRLGGVVGTSEDFATGRLFVKTRDQYFGERRLYELDFSTGVIVALGTPDTSDSDAFAIGPGGRLYTTRPEPSGGWKYIARRRDGTVVDLGLPGVMAPAQSVVFDGRNRLAALRIESPRVLEVIDLDASGEQGSVVGRFPLPTVHSWNGYGDDALSLGYSPDGTLHVLFKDGLRPFDVVTGTLSPDFTIEVPSGLNGRWAATTDGSQVTFDADGHVAFGYLYCRRSTATCLYSTDGGARTVTLMRSGLLVLPRFGSQLTGLSTGILSVEREWRYTSVIETHDPAEVRRLLDTGPAHAIWSCPRAEVPAGLETCAPGATPVEGGCRCTAGVGDGYNVCTPCGAHATASQRDPAGRLPLGKCQCDRLHDGDPYTGCTPIPKDVDALCGGAYRTLTNSTRRMSNARTDYSRAPMMADLMSLPAPGSPYPLDGYKRATDWAGPGWYRFGSGLGDAMFDVTFDAAGRPVVPGDCGGYPAYLLDGQPTAVRTIEIKHMGVGVTPTAPEPTDNPDALLRYDVPAVNCGSFKLYYLSEFGGRYLESEQDSKGFAISHCSR